MASTPSTWLLVQAIRTALTVITVANNYRTNIGTSVSAEGEQAEDTSAPFAAVALERFATYVEVLNRRSRECIVLVEVVVPATAPTAQQVAHDAIEDVVDVYKIETKATLAAGVEATITLAEARILERPDGLEAIVGQIRFRCRIHEPLP